MASKKKEHKLKVLGPDIFRSDGCLPCERVGSKRFCISLETQGKLTFWHGIPRFWLGYPGGAEKFDN